MNDFLREFVMKTIRDMIGNVAEWQVREYALGWYTKGVLTKEDLEEIDEMHEPTMTEDVTVEDSSENEPTVAENETIETEEEEQ